MFAWNSGRWLLIEAVELTNKDWQMVDQKIPRPKNKYSVITTLYASADNYLALFCLSIDEEKPRKARLADCQIPRCPRLSLSRVSRLKHKPIPSGTRSNATILRWARCRAHDDVQYFGASFGVRMWSGLVHKLHKVELSTPSCLGKVHLLSTWDICSGKRYLPKTETGTRLNFKNKSYS